MTRTLQNRLALANVKIKNGWESPLGLGPFEIRAELRQAAAGPDAFKRDTAFKMLRSLNDRGSLLWLRRQPGETGERARRELIQMTGSTS
jgi:hypothetical protein